MKFGFRKPSLKRSISAMTTGALKRAILREIIPGYGKRGMGWANPKKAAYNHLYSMVTANPIDLVLNKPRLTRAVSKPNLSEPEYQSKINNINIYKKGIAQTQIAIELLKTSKEIQFTETHLDKAIRRIFTYSSGYLNKSMMCGFDFCEMCEERLNKIQRINPQVKNLCFKIVMYIRQGKTANEIYDSLYNLE